MSPPTAFGGEVNQARPPLSVGGFVLSNRKPGREEKMNLKRRALVLAAIVFLALGGRLLARHVTHQVTPKNIDSQPFAFSVQVKDVAQVKEFEIVVKQKPNHRAPIASATGTVDIAPRDKKKAESPAVTRVEAHTVQTYTFRVSPSDVNRAHFTFTETPQDPRVPFPFPGDYWVFDLSQFAGASHK